MDALETKGYDRLKIEFNRSRHDIADQEVTSLRIRMYVMFKFRDINLGCVIN